jgi:multisubunit Na+/H+ antiporter MnhB subunit
MVMFDGILAASLVFLAWRSLQAPHLFTSVVLFIAFGLLMALAWVRLDASDIALAEAAIGAGITGALLLDALGHAAAEPRARRDDESEALALPRAVPEQGTIRSASRRGRWLLAALVAPLAALIAFGAWTMPEARLVRDAVAGALERHPVANPATAVLLDFRAYDTFLEMGVLALAALGAFLLKARTLQYPRADPPSRGRVILVVFATGLVPLMILMAGYLFWAGTIWSGGAFPAGAMLGAAAVLLFLAGIGREMIVDHDRTRFVIALGLLSFIAAGAVAMIAGRAFLDWGEDWTYAAIVAVEALLTLSIGGVLALLYGASAKVPPQALAEGAPGHEGVVGDE